MTDFPLKQGLLLAFQLQEEFLSPKTSGVSGQCAVRTDDAMTGDENGYRILTIRMRDGSNGFRVTDHLALFQIGARAAVSDFLKCSPDLNLKWRAVGRQGYSKVL